MESEMSTATQLPLPSLIRASSWDAGNFSMMRGKRTKWSRKDYNAAAETQNRLVKATFGVAGEEDRVAFLRFGLAEQLEKQRVLHIGMTYRQFVTAFNAAVAA
jgi:hypothetical protein